VVFDYSQNNIPLEATWQFMDILKYPAILDDEPLDIAAEGADPQPGHWPEVKKVTAETEMHAVGGNAHPMRKHFLDNDLARYSEGISPQFQKSLDK